MIATIHPCRLAGTVIAPASKSAAHRALIASALADGQTLLHLNALNDDLEATIGCLAALGATIDHDVRQEQLIVRPIEGAPGLRRPPAWLVGRAMARAEDCGRILDLDCGESGSTLRFLLPVVCALGMKARLTGRSRLPERPNRALVEALRAHGADIDSDRPPMTAAGPLLGGMWALPGNVSSQYVTGLLFALPLLPEDSEIVLTTKLESAAYVDMTLQTLARFGIAAEPTGAGWRVPGGQAYRTPSEVRVEGDWSAAAFWLAANAMGADIRVDGLSDDTAQGDRAIIGLLKQADVDASNVPDLVPALAAAAAVLPRRTTITGAARLRLKESDRLAAVADMIGRLGGRVEVTGDGLVIDGGRPLHGGMVDGRNDHRIVMAAAILATAADGPVRVTDAQAVSKSYPEFFDHFRALGGIIDVESAGR